MNTEDDNENWYDYTKNSSKDDNSDVLIVTAFAILMVTSLGIFFLIYMMVSLYVCCCFPWRRRRIVNISSQPERVYAITVAQYVNENNNTPQDILPVARQLSV